MNSIINNAKLITLNEYEALSEEEKSDIEKAETLHMSELNRMTILE